MIHVVFNTADVQLLKKTITIDESLQGKIFEIKDDYAVGPIGSVQITGEAFQERKDWWQEVLQFSPYEQQLNIVNDNLTVYQIKKHLEENEQEFLWIWMAQNSHDVCGYYWLLAQLQAFKGRIYIIFLNNLPFINEKGGLFYPQYLHEILPKECVKAKKLAREIMPGEWELDEQEWQKHIQQKQYVRVLEGGKQLSGKKVDFFDSYILKEITADLQKLPKLINTILQKLPVKTGDSFLVWRIRILQALGKLKIEGNWERGWKEITIALNT
ncbi:MAG: DUF1835 domain-containing protein [Chitinophagaceae bacterium]